MGYRWDHVAIIGVGLLGGSIGLALRKRRLARRVSGIGRNAEHLDRAQQLGCITVASTDMAQTVRDADVIIVATPVDTIAALVREVAGAAQHPWLITDVGSVKRAIVEELRDLPPSTPFVGSHPLAGSEKSGCEFARADLFSGRVTFVTPGGEPQRPWVERAVEFWESLGGSVEVMDAARHDELMAATSHLPHVVASALAATVEPSVPAAIGSGYRDTTRLAAGNVEMWVPILLANRERVLAALRDFQHTIASWDAALESSDAQMLAQLLRQGKDHRDAVGG